MTGFGSIQIDNDDHSVSVEVKTLNSKFLDITIRLPRQFNDRELEIRNLISQKIVRGKVTMNVDFEPKGELAPKAHFNKQLFSQYYNQLEELANEVGGSHESLVRIAIQQPEVVESASPEVSEKQWEVLADCCSKAIDSCDRFRSNEGINLEEVLVNGVKEIKKLKEQIAQIDSQRVDQIKSRITNNLEETIGRDRIDENRFEQELIYYLEKLDISEELVRLDSHIEYFLEVIGNGESNGKKLGFIAQELGREINTIGSKSNFAPMQRFVVEMKDELEKIKEQTLNVL